MNPGFFLSFPYFFLNCKRERTTPFLIPSPELTVKDHYSLLINYLLSPYRKLSVCLLRPFTGWLIGSSSSFTYRSHCFAPPPICPSLTFKDEGNRLYDHQVKRKRWLLSCLLGWLSLIPLYYSLDWLNEVNRIGLCSPSPRKLGFTIPLPAPRLIDLILSCFHSSPFGRGVSLVRLYNSGSPLRSFYSISLTPLYLSNSVSWLSSFA